MAHQQRNPAMVRLLSADFITNRYPLALHGDSTGFAVFEATLVDETPVVLISAHPTLGVLVAVHYEALIAGTAGTFDFVSGELALLESATLFTDANGDVILEMDVTGVLVIYATADQTARVQLELKWI